jgi:queuosine precursor transporter
MAEGWRTAVPALPQHRRPSELTRGRTALGVELVNTAAIRQVEARELRGAQFRYFDFVMVAMVVVLLLSNVIGAEKRSFVNLPGIGAWPFGAGILFFPISYLIDDVLTEVYGYARARRAIWAGFVALAFMAVMEWTVVHLPVASGWTGQEAYERVFGSGWRIIIASMSAFFVGDFIESVVMAKLKIWSQGRHLWMRFWGSTIVGEGIDSLIFYPLAFYGMADWPVSALAEVMLSQFILKVSWEVLLTPVTYAVVGWLKRKEGVDVYDIGTNFTPFTAKV